MKISILIPVYNEARTLPQLLPEVQHAPLPASTTREIIVIDDGSDDATSEILRASTGITVLHHERNQGKGAATRAGLAVATGDVVLIQDGDLEYDPNDYEALVTPIVKGRANVVYGSRFRGSPDRMTRRNRIANRILTTTTNLLYGARLTDEATGYKVFRADVLRSLALESQGFEFCAEVTAKALRAGYKIYEIPIRYNARTCAEGKKIRARDGFKSWWTLVRLRFSPAATIATPAQIPVSSA